MGVLVWHFQCISSHSGITEMSDPLNINVQSSTGDKYPLQIAGTATIAELKKQLAEKAQVDANRIRLIYKGRVLKDNTTLDDGAVEDGNTLHMVVVAHSAPSPAPAPAASAPAPAAATNPWGALANSMAPGQEAQQGGLPGMPSADAMQAAMNSPMMQSMLNNPELLRSIMMSNPAMMQEMMRNQDRAMANIESHPGGFNALRQVF